jgi:hypothetical protein
VEEMMTANQQEKSRLEERLQMASQELAASVAKEANLRNELLALKRDFARLEMKEVQFRDIIISNAATQQVTDQEVIQAFSELRQTVQQLAKNQAFDLAQTPLLVPPDAKQSDKHFYKKIQGLPPKDVNSRVRMRIWEIVYSYILSQTVFGLKKARNYDIEGEDGNRFLWDIEEGLTDFEDYLKASKKGLVSTATKIHLLTCLLVSNRMIADWRVCTLQCIDLMELPGGYSSHVVNRMYSCFAPLISKNATKSLRDELGEKMLNVCTKAVALKMMMQHSKEGYNVQTVNLKEYPSYSNCRHFMESMGVEDGRASDASDDIAYVLFGVLMKYPMDTVGDNKVLLKAEVILKKNLRR